MLFIVQFFFPPLNNVEPEVVLILKNFKPSGVDSLHWNFNFSPKRQFIYITFAGHGFKRLKTLGG